MAGNSGRYLAVRNSVSAQVLAAVNLSLRDKWRVVYRHLSSDIFDAQGLATDQKILPALPAEYRHEPALALAAGEDGLDVVRRILREAADHLTPEGFIAIEVGRNRDQVEAAFPHLPVVWLDTASSVDKIFLVSCESLRVENIA